MIVFSSFNRNPGFDPFVRTPGFFGLDPAFGGPFVHEEEVFNEEDFPFFF